MKIYAIYAQMEDEPRCYVQAKNVKELIKIMRERKEFGMFPGWSPVEISKKKMYKILKRFNEDDIYLVDEDKQSDFNLFAKMQTQTGNDTPIIEALKEFRLYKLKYSVNLTEKDIEKIKKDNALYQEKLSKLIEQASKLADNIKGQLFNLANLACLDEWNEYSENEYMGYDLKKDEENLRHTGDRNINLLIEILDKIEEVKK